MSKAWDLSDVCTCRGEYEICNICVKPGNGVPAVVDEPTGYHVNAIPRGIYGESSKILEEVLELIDAEKQGARLMALQEMSDIIGAVHGYLRKHYPDMKFEDLVKMANLTRRAFESGGRS